jgi:hypothetical protein
MKISKNAHAISNLDDWFRFAPPQQGDKHWVETRSAKELARFWLNPDSVKTIKESLEQVFGGLEFVSGEPERLVKFDRFGESRHCDLAITATTSIGACVVIHVEGKADEPFDKLIGPYYHRMLKNPRSKVPARIDQLAWRLFGRSVDGTIEQLWYQLLHGTGAVLADAASSRADAAVLIVQEFRSKVCGSTNLARNSEAWADFLRMFPELVMEHFDKSVVGPVSVHVDDWRRIPLFFAKYTVHL